MQGDWVRFYQSGKLVIGQVEYIAKGITGRYEIKTDIGSITEDFVFEVRKRTKECYCYNCADNNTRMTRIILCPECGNKRCPKATDHNNACTNSNEPGQEGSRY